VYLVRSHINYTLVRYPRFVDFNAVLAFYTVARHSTLLQPLCQWPKGTDCEYFSCLLIVVVVICVMTGLGTAGIVLQSNPITWVPLGLHLSQKVDIDNSTVRGSSGDNRLPTFEKAAKSVTSQMLSLVGHIHELGYSFRPRMLPIWNVDRDSNLKLHPGRLVLLPLCKRLFAAYQGGTSSPLNFLPIFQGQYVDKSIDLSAFASIPTKARPRVKPRPTRRDGSEISFPRTKHEMFRTASANYSRVPIVLDSGSSIADGRCEIAIEINGFGMLADMVAVHAILPAFKLSNNIFVSHDYANGYYFTHDPANTDLLGKTILDAVTKEGFVVQPQLSQLIQHITGLLTAAPYSCPQSSTTCLNDVLGKQQFSKIAAFDYWKP
jgi:hypothetical protein